jgi:hypothetical protein
MQTLEQEQFNSLKQLSEIQIQISEGRVVLQELINKKEEYLKLQEKEVMERVDKVLIQSRQALQATTNNHDELSSYNRDLTAYAGELKGFSNVLSTLNEDLTERMNQSDKDMAKHYESVSEILKRVKVEKSAVEAERRVLNLERAEIRDGWRLLKDRQETLKKGFEELKAKAK